MLKMAGGAEMPFSIAVRYNAVKPPTSEQCKVTIETTLRQAEVREGSLTEAVVTVTNKSNEAVPTPIAIVGIPGGLEVRHDQLKELVKQQKIAAYEVIGREVVLYWRSLKAGAARRAPVEPHRRDRRLLHRAGQPRVPVLHRRAQALGPAVGREHHAQVIGRAAGTDRVVHGFGSAALAGSPYRMPRLREERYTRPGTRGSPLIEVISPKTWRSSLMRVHVAPRSSERKKPYFPSTVPTRYTAG